jgi:protocatechuate 3,4-dioxygenase beta subunit
MRKQLCALICAISMLLVVIPLGLFAQMAGTGQVVGTVTDPSGAAIVDAAVTLTDTATNATRTAVTNDSGRYNFSNVQPGR